MTTPAPDKPRLGFAGLGHMGSRMAARLLDAGFPLTVFNRTPSRAADLVNRGATLAPTPKDLAANSDIILTMLTDGAAVAHVLHGTTGLLAGLRPGSLLADMSTVSVASSLATHAVAQSKGAACLDAPVSGSTPQAEAGKLLILAGGDQPTFDRCQPIFSALSQRATLIGPPGSGTKMKLCINALLALGIQALAESLALGVKSGLDLNLMLTTLADTAVLSPSQKSKLDNIRANSYPSAFPLPLMHKDLGLILQQAQLTNTPLPSTAATTQSFAAAHARALATHTPNDDMSAIVRFLLQSAQAPT